MKNVVGAQVKQRQSVADVFATFYEQLYKDVHKANIREEHTNQNMYKSDTAEIVLPLP